MAPLTRIDSGAQPAVEAPKRPASPAIACLPGDCPVAAHLPEHSLIRKIASGSYGEVWLARHSLGTYRAVKVVSRRTFTHERPYEREFRGIQKFEPISRRHDGLINVLFVGRDIEAGYFYYIMELADDAASGTQIDPERYLPNTLAELTLQRKRLPVSECIPLALQITSALAFLHQHGLTHRDIKPSNIIFIGGVPKLADIGLVTDLGEARSYVGTEGFIPPEGPGTIQADIYSLGKVLYEISTGKDRQEYPALPAELDETKKERDFLEFNEVVLKACRADPAERYRSARELRDDLLLLQGGNSLQQFRAVQRRLKLATRLGAVITVIAVTAVTAYVFAHRQFLREARLRMQTVQALQRATRVEDMNVHAARLLTAGAPASMLETLERAAQSVGERFKDAPELQLQTLRALAQAYAGMGQYEKTEEILREALPLAEKLHGESSLAAAEVAVALANDFTDESAAARYKEGERLCRRGVAILKQELGADSFDYSDSLLVLGDLLDRRGKLLESMSAIRESWLIRRKLLGDDNALTAGSLDAVAAITEDAGESEKAERLYREVLAIRRKLMDQTGGFQSTLDVAHTLNHLGSILQKQNRLTEARAPFREALALRSKLLGDHPAVADSLAALGLLLVQSHQLPEAESIYRRELAMRERLRRPDMAAQATARRRLARVLRAEGKVAEAQEIQREPTAGANFQGSSR